MYARVTRVKSDPARIDDLADELKAQMVPVFEQQKGYLGVVTGANRETGEGATTTYWDSMENLKASEAAIFAARDKFSQEHGAEILGFHRCEVVTMEQAGAPTLPGFNRVVTVSGGDPAKIDEAIRVFRDDALPIGKTQPGFRAAILMVDRENSIAFAVSAWDSKEHRDASDAALAPKRAAAAQAAGGQANVMLTEVTHIDLKLPVTH